jgi:hypothetical protein
MLIWVTLYAVIVVVLVSGDDDTKGNVDNPGTFKNENPELFIIGAPKCATTSLFALLKQHPSICAGKEKEPQFFNHHFNKGEKYYVNHFPSKLCTKKNGKFIDASPDYLHSREAPTNMMTAYGNRLHTKKLIVLLRNPIEREYSWYNHLVKNCVPKIRGYMKRKKLERLDGDAIWGACKISKHCRDICDRQNPNPKSNTDTIYTATNTNTTSNTTTNTTTNTNINGNATTTIKNTSTTVNNTAAFMELKFMTFKNVMSGLMSFDDFLKINPLHRSSYSDNIRRWLQVFDRKQILIMNFDTLITNQTESMKSIANFFNIEPFHEGTKLPKVNSARKDPSLKSPLLCKTIRRIADEGMNIKTNDLYKLLNEGIKPTDELPFPKFVDPPCL